MNEQTVMFVPGSGGRETLVPTLLARRDDPDTSKRAARRVSARDVAEGLALLTTLLRLHGPMTVVEASRRTSNPAYWNHEWARRVKQWAIKGHVELTGEERGGRVWAIPHKEAA